MHLQPALHWCVHLEGPDTTLIPLILVIQVGSLGVTWCNHLLMAGLASKMQLTLQPDPTAQLFYRVLVITEGKKWEAIPSHQASR